MAPGVYQAVVARANVETNRLRAASIPAITYYRLHLYSIPTILRLMS